MSNVTLKCELYIKGLDAQGLNKPRAYIKREEGIFRSK